MYKYREELIFDEPLFLNRSASFSFLEPPSVKDVSDIVSNIDLEKVREIVEKIQDIKKK